MDGSLVIKSKQLETHESDQDDEAKMIMNALQPNFKSKAKNYKYFYRGQYSVVPDTEDMIGGINSKKQKLQPFEHTLKRFQYQKALTQAIDSKNPEVVIALIEELVHRNGLEIALANRSEADLVKVLEFIQWKVSDYRYQSVLI